MKLYENILYSIHCAIIGDIIGFGNGEVEFNFNESQKIGSRSDIDKISQLSDRHVADFISKGGYTNIDISKDIASDDTILTLAVLDALIETYNIKNINIIIDQIKLHMIHYFGDDSKFNLRAYGNRTIKSFERITKEKDWNKFAFSENAGGCGTSMRSMPIGLIYYGEKNRDKLMEISIQSSRITHNNPIGYLGGYVSALFTAFAMEKIDPQKWIFKLVKYLDSNKLKDFIKKVVCKEFPNDHNKHIGSYNQFLSLCNKYIKLKFNEEKYKDNSKDVFMRLFNQRSQFYYNHFGSKGTFNPGSNGFDSVIIAYDCLLDCKGSFETMIYYSMLHAGDSDSTGCIAGALYGAYYGRFVLPKNLYKIEFYDKTKKLVDKYKQIVTTGVNTSQMNARKRLFNSDIFKKKIKKKILKLNIP